MNRISCMQAGCCAAIRTRCMLQHLCKVYMLASTAFKEIQRAQGSATCAALVMATSPAAQLPTTCSSEPHEPIHRTGYTFSLAEL